MPHRWKSSVDLISVLIWNQPEIGVKSCYWQNGNQLTEIYILYIKHAWKKDVRQWLEVTAWDIPVREGKKNWQKFLKHRDEFLQEEFLTCSISILETHSLMTWATWAALTLAQLSTRQDQMTSKRLFKPKFSKIPWKHAGLLITYI